MDAWQTYELDMSAEPVLAFTGSGNSVTCSTNSMTVLEHLAVSDITGATGTQTLYIDDVSFQTATSPPTLTLTPTAGGTVGGGGTKTAGKDVTVTATPSSGYRFLGWSTDSGGTSIVSTSTSYTFTMPGLNYTLYANFTDKWLMTVGVGSSGGGTVTGGGQHTVGDRFDITATPNTGYTFVKWSTRADGSDSVSTDNPYNVTMPNNDYALYAIFTPGTYTLAVNANANGAATSTPGDGGVIYNTSVTAKAVPDAGYCFKGWSTDSAGNTIVSTFLTYTFSMPGSNYTIYANFVPQNKFAYTEGFESYVAASVDGTGNPANPSANNFGSIDSNDTGPNNGGSNPWWGTNPRNGGVCLAAWGTTPHSGNKMLWSAYSGNGTDYYNFAFRNNGGRNVQGNFCVDWYFQDTLGTTFDLAGNYIGDSLRLLSYHKASPNQNLHVSNADYDSTSNYTDSNFNSRLQLGCASDNSTGFQSGKYQARIMGGSSSYANGWYNLGLSRSVGWHHARIVVGPVKSDTTNDVSFYIDDMSTAAKTASLAAYGYNLICTETEMKIGANWGKWAYYDDITVETLPSMPSLEVSPAYASTSTTATFGGSFSSSSVSYLVSVNGGAFAPATSPLAIDVSGWGQGSYSVAVKAVDASNWESGVATAMITVDRTPPTTPIISSVDVNGLSATVTFGGSVDSSPFHYELKLDGGSFAPAASPKLLSGLSGGSHTVYVKAVDDAGLESGVASHAFVVDGVPPAIADISVTPQNVGATGNCLKGKLWVDAHVTDAGGSGLASVQIKLDDGDYEDMPVKDGGNPGDYENEYTIDASWANRAHSVTIRATDGAGNVSICDPIAFNVNKNEITGAIGLQNFTAALKYREVAFVLNGSTTKVVNLGFLNGMAAYSIVDVPDLTTISAKTAWSLRRLITGLSASDGQYEANFTGTKTVLGGDLTGDNVINALDYSALRGAWGTSSVGDINGDGYTDNADYLIQKANWYGKGDAQ